MKIYQKIVKYIIIFNLLKFDKIIFFHESISQLKIIKNEFICNFPEYDQYSTSKNDILIYYYIYQKYIFKGFKDWKLIFL